MSTNVFYPSTFFFPLFTEISSTLSAEALHPDYTLEMLLPANINKVYNLPDTESITYCKQLWEKLITMRTYDFGPFICYHLESIVDKREWIEKFILLIESNKNAFMDCTKPGVYEYLFVYISQHYSVFNSPLQMSLYAKCEDCRHEKTTNVHHSLDFFKKLTPAERKYSEGKLKNEIIQYGYCRDFGFGKSLLKVVDNETANGNLVEEFMNDLKTERDEHEKKDVSGLKKIRLNCSAREFGEKRGKEIKDEKNEMGQYLYEYDNTSLAEWMVSTYHFNIGNQVTAKTMMGYLPLLRTHKK